MKKLTLILFILISVFGFSQDTTMFKNEIGVDITSIFREIFGYNYGNYPYYSYNSSPKYYVNYRRKLGKGYFRFGMGGNLRNGTNSFYNPNDSTFVNGYSKNTSIDLRLGFEIVKYFHKKWAIYYGLDLRPGLNFQSNQSPYSRGYLVTNEYDSKYIGLAPLVGIRFNVNNKLCFTAEGNCMAVYSSTSNTQSFQAIISGNPDLPSKDRGTTEEVNINFIQPFSLSVAYHF